MIYMAERFLSLYFGRPDAWEIQVEAGIISLVSESEVGSPGRGCPAPAGGWLSGGPSLSLTGPGPGHHWAASVEWTASVEMDNPQLLNFDSVTTIQNLLKRWEFGTVQSCG